MIERMKRIVLVLALVLVGCATPRHDTFKGIDCQPCDLQKVANLC